MNRDDSKVQGAGAWIDVSTVRAEKRVKLPWQLTADDAVSSTNNKSVLATPGDALGLSHLCNPRPSHLSSTSKSIIASLYENVLTGL